MKTQEQIDNIKGELADLWTAISAANNSIVALSKPPKPPIERAKDWLAFAVVKSPWVLVPLALCWFVWSWTQRPDLESNDFSFAILGATLSVIAGVVSAICGIISLAVWASRRWNN